MNVMVQIWCEACLLIGLVSLVNVKTTGYVALALGVIHLARYALKI